MLNAHDPILGFFFGNGRGLVSIVSLVPTLRYSATCPWRIAELGQNQMLFGC